MPSRSFVLLRILWLAPLLALIYLVFAAKPALDSLWIEVSTTKEFEGEVKAYFLRDKKVVHSDQSTRHSKGNTILLSQNLPKHVEHDGIFFDLGRKPNSWRVENVSVRSSFLIFRLKAYDWPLQGFEEQLSTYLDSSTIKSGVKPRIVTKKWPFRFHLQLDSSKLSQSTELLLLKAFVALSLVGLYSFLLSGYFKRLLTTRKKDYLLFVEQFEQFRDSHKFERYFGALALLLLMLFLGREIILQPGLYIEDSMEFTDALADNLNLFDPATYDYYRGYPVLLTKWIVYFTTFFPLEWQPYLYVGFGVGMCWIAMVALSNSVLLQTRAAVILGPTLLFVGSFNVPTMYLSLTGVFFSSIALLVALVLRPSPKSWLGFFMFAALLAILAWSGPYAPQILPIALALLLLASSGKKNVLLIGLMVLAVLYTLNSASSMVQLNHALDSQIRAEFFNAYTAFILTFGVMGDPGYKLGLAILTFSTLILVWYRNDRLYVKHAVIFILSSMASLTTYFISFKYIQYGGELISAHLVIAQFFWMVFCVLTLDRIFRSIQTFKFAIINAQLASFLFAALITSVLFVGKKQTAFIEDQLKPDQDLGLFLEAVEYFKNHQLKADEFVQLWDVNSQAYVTSFRKGSTSPTSISVSLNDVPSEYQKFVLPVDLERRENTMLQYYFHHSSLWYSDLSIKPIPDHLGTYHSQKFGTIY